ncbi:hypothetical protein M501DRAFT_1003267 [Patellaria atrata CBS 101060]|uniref:Uncharacterized protein n=1 Tax=Patellaria atrata CBS 101060 TaxID=1346257 RepID=A0A9P4SBW1_9PEZI|nr:hypothetical protein M501DRAFT_1003267 [Patellaria atrata CBS 101060]
MTPLKNKLLQLAAESSITIHSPSTAGTGTSIRKQRNVKGTPMSKVSPSIASPLSIIDTPSKPSLLPPLDLPKSLSALLAEADSTPVNAAQTMTLPTPPASPKTPTPFRSKIPRPIYPARPLTMTQKIPTRLLFQAHANKNIDPPTPLPATTVYTTIPRYASAHDLHALYNNIASGTTIPEVKANGPVEEGIIIRDFAPSIHGSRKLARVSEVEHEGDEHRKEHEPVKTKEATENSDVQRLREHQQLENKATTQIDGSTATAGHITAVPDHEEAHKKHGLICKLKEKMAGKSHKSKTVERESSNKLTKKAHPPRDFRDRVLRRVFPVVL